MVFSPRFFVLTIFLSVEPAWVGIHSLESGLPFFKHRQFNPSSHSPDNALVPVKYVI